MNTPWVIWGFCMVLIVAGSFTFLEARAFKHPEQMNTLSRSMWTLGQKWPLSLVLWGLTWGMLVGGLSVHFYWNWCPALMPAGIGG